MRKLQAHGGAHEGGGVRNRSANERHGPLGGPAGQRLQEAAGGNDGGRGTDDRHEEHQRPVQAGDKLVQRQHPGVRFRLAQGDAVEGGRDIQHRREGLRQGFG